MKPMLVDEDRNQEYKKGPNGQGKPFPYGKAARPYPSNPPYASKYEAGDKRPPSNHDSVSYPPPDSNSMHPPPNVGGRSNSVHSQYSNQSQPPPQSLLLRHLGVTPSIRERQWMVTCIARSRNAWRSKKLYVRDKYPFDCLPRRVEGAKEKRDQEKRVQERAKTGDLGYGASESESSSRYNPTRNAPPAPGTDRSHQQPQRSLRQPQRNARPDDHPEPDKLTTVLILTYKVASQGLNFQGLQSSCAVPGLGQVLQQLNTDREPSPQSLCSCNVRSFLHQNWGSHS